MIDLGDVFLAAWARVKPYLDSHPAELHACLARRHTARLQRPLREWAIALRANDRRKPSSPSSGRRLTPNVKRAPREVEVPRLAGASHLPFENFARWARC